MGSKAYEEGFKSCLYSDYANPYPEDSSEFDDYERGRTQKLKRSGSNSSFSGGFDLWESDIEPVRDVEYKPKASSVETQKPNLYAQAKGK
ncbi:TPA: hypothetical protein ACQYCV_004584 [Vibrio parahaemolyticus]|uniref:hypothetical protein n=1 Tax=Vibrio parahaemolyticus TaxID=670 RepID=UPI0028793F0D|nr:hypothetical protein [Vibrio parahaemolyticus]MDS1868877.1 hypothetical protein [Vibrio parahaemolyticus]HCE2385361.1 hypothetical protein [Vibrio parahaemolyticus]HCG7063065.1 hypothetical protein [Vibrio parahaemolyticus]HCG8084947.1 hypothetical protein [Vibrio parahaemolyticus]